MTWTKKQLESHYEYRGKMLDIYKDIVSSLHRNTSHLEDRIFLLELLLSQAGVELPNLNRMYEPEVEAVRKEKT